MSGRFVDGCIHWRIDGDNPPAIARLRGEGLKLLGQLRDILRDTPSGVLQHRFHDGIVRAEYAFFMPIVTITVVGGGGGNEEISLFMDSGLLFFDVIEVRRQTQQKLAMRAQRSFLGTLIFNTTRDDFRFLGDDRNGAKALAEVGDLVVNTLVSGRARLLRQALLGRMDTYGLRGIEVMASLPNFGLMLSNGKYYCLCIENNTVFVAPLRFSMPATRVAAMDVGLNDVEKREAYLLSLANLHELHWTAIGNAEFSGSPLAYGWNWRWDGQSATIVTHVIEDHGASASFTANHYHMAVTPKSAFVTNVQTVKWYPRRQTTNIWYPVGPSVVCIIPPLTSASYPDTLEYDAPIYSFYRKDGAECVVRLSHTIDSVDGEYNFDSNAEICGLGSTGWKYTHDGYAKHNYMINIAADGVHASGYSYTAIGSNVIRAYSGESLEIGVFALTTALAHDCPPGAADDIPNYGNLMIPASNARFTVMQTLDASFLSLPQIAIVISPFDCEAVTIMSGETVCYERTEIEELEQQDNILVFHFPEHDVTTTYNPGDDYHQYDRVRTEHMIDQSYTFLSKSSGIILDDYEENKTTPGQSRVFLNPSIEEMLLPHDPLLFRQGAGSCWFVQKPTNKLQYASSQTIDIAKYISAFVGWA